MAVTDGIARKITTAFSRGEFKSKRPGAPLTNGWVAMPEVHQAHELKAWGAEDMAIRHFITFTAAMDRSRNADVLWEASKRLFKKDPWLYQPKEVAIRPLGDLQKLLKENKVSQRHDVDSEAWRTIGTTLSHPSIVPAVTRAIVEGQGDARVLLKELEGKSGSAPMFPLLKGPKIGLMWVRMLVCPGNANISSLEIIPVAVDVHVRKVTEYLGVSDTRGEVLENVREKIQQAWAKDVRENGAEGPGLLSNTSSAVDPAVWFLGKWGCTHCENSRRKVPIANVCGSCRFDDLNPGGVVAKPSGRGCRG
jgi:hypothetical protein